MQISTRQATNLPRSKVVLEIDENLDESQEEATDNRFSTMQIERLLKRMPSYKNFTPGQFMAT